MFLTFMTVICGLAAASWLVGMIQILLSNRGNPILTASPDRTSTATVSIVVPARNEGGRILAESVDSMLNQNHQATEVVAVDDRSTDNTLLILESAKAASSRTLIVVKGKELPEQWLGKPFALQQAFEVSTGDWILTTDADIIFDPRAVGTAVSYAEEKGYDALTLLPRVDMESFWERVFMPVFGWLALLAMPLDKVNDPDRPEHMGIGNFFLIRRAVLDKLGGFERIRSEVAEDIRLAGILKSEGFRLRIETAPELISTRMYSGLADIWQGFTKNLFAPLNFSLIRGFFSVASITGLGFLPSIAGPILLVSGYSIAGFFCLTAYIFQIIAFGVLLKNIGQRPLYAFAVPLGFLLFALILLNSMVRILTGQGVKWKDRSIYQSGGVVPPKA